MVLSHIYNYVILCCYKLTDYDTGRISAQNGFHKTLSAYTGTETRVGKATQPYVKSIWRLQNILEILY